MSIKFIVIVLIIKEYEGKETIKHSNRAGNVKCCEHPETLALRGLLLLGLGKTQEAEDSVKRGLKNNLRYGSLYLRSAGTSCSWPWQAQEALESVNRGHRTASDRFDTTDIISRTSILWPQ
jgi:hypothetical protein